MGILRSLKKFFSGPPYELEMQLSKNAVQLSIRRGNSPVQHNDLLTQRGIPDVLVEFFKNRTPIREGVYHLSFPAARQMSQVLAVHASDSFKVNTAPLDLLKEISPPRDFCIHWQYDSQQQQLTRQLENSEGYLGDAWFFRGEEVWSMVDSLPDDAWRWLNKPILRDHELVPFCTQVLPRLPSAWCKCDLTADADFQANVVIVQMLKQSMDVQVKTNKPQLAHGLQALGETEHLISGSVFLPGWRAKLPGQLLELARSGSVRRIQGHDLLAFIQDQLIPHAQALSVDKAALQAHYPILDAARCPTGWKLDHLLEGGIGSYRVLPCVRAGRQLVSVDQITRKISSNSRFHALEDGWLEFTPQFVTKHKTWLKQGLKPIRLLPQEVLGTHLERMKKWSIDPPSIAVIQEGNETQQALEFLDTLRLHGLPAGFSGLQQETPAILAELCKRLLKENPSAQILWLLPRRKLNEASQSLKKLGVSHSDAGSYQAGKVCITSPDTLLRDVSWHLIIFTDLDAIAAGERQSKIYAAMRRMWSIATFSREDWYQDSTRAQRILHVLGLSSADLKTFLKVCNRRFSQQADGLLARLLSPFKRILVDDNQENQTGGVPIPPRQTPPPQSAPKRPEEVYRPSLTASVTRSESHQSFVKQAQRFAKRVEAPVDPVPFTQYWPTYDSMTRAQAQWYFYWRSQVRKKNYLPCDLSYLFIYIYEIIHLIEFASPQAAYDDLVAFWEHYRRFHPKLDNYLVDWIADFAVVYKLSQNPLDWYAYASAQGARLTDGNLAIEVWRAKKQPFSQMPGALFDRISDYHYTKSKFYQQHKSPALVDKAMRQALDAVDGFLQQRGQSLFDYCRPPSALALQRQPFASAVYEGPRERIEIATVSLWGSSGRLQSVIASILKHTENRLRRQYGFKGTLRGIELPAEWMLVLDRLFPAQPEIPQQPKPLAPGKAAVQPLAIDFERVKSLTQEADALRERRLTVIEDARGEISHLLGDRTRSMGNESDALGKDHSSAVEDFRSEILYLLDYRIRLLSDDADALSRQLSTEEEKNNTLSGTRWIDDPPVTQSTSVEDKVFFVNQPQVEDISSPGQDEHKALNVQMTEEMDEIASFASAPSDIQETQSEEDTSASSAEPDRTDSPLIIDFSRVKALITDSDVIRQRLSVEDSETEHSADNLPLLNSAQPEQAAVSQGFNTERPPDTPDHLLTDLAEVAEVLWGDPSGMSLLQTLMANDWEAEQDEVQALIENEFLTVILDRLNDRAIERLGDQIILTEGSRLVVTEDFRDEILHLLSSPQLIEAFENRPDKSQYADLEPEWAEFVAQMRPHHWKALNALLLGEDVVARLDGIARGAYTTLDLLIDEINEAALSSIGDIVIETGDEPRIEDEDIESLSSLMNWATKTIELEF
jgi:hypothetical protein